jgi:hypothetical protein
VSLQLSSSVQAPSDLDIKPEMELRQSIKEVLEEIEIFLGGLKKQKDILLTLKGKMTDKRSVSPGEVFDDGDISSNSEAAKTPSFGPLDRVVDRNNATPEVLLTSEAKQPRRGRGRRRSKQTIKTLTDLTDRMIRKLEDREKGLNNLLSSAERTARGVSRAASTKRDHDY